MAIQQGPVDFGTAKTRKPFTIPKFAELSVARDTWREQWLSDIETEQNTRDAVIEQTGTNFRIEVTFDAWIKSGSALTEIVGGNDRIQITDPETNEVYIFLVQTAEPQRNDNKPGPWTISMTWFQELDTTDTNSTRPVIT